MAASTPRSYDMKAVSAQFAMNYTAFGWQRSKEPIPSDMKGANSKKPSILLKRRKEYGMNDFVVSKEAEYDKLVKKCKGSKAKKAWAVIFGIITFILLVAFLAVAGVSLYYGITKGINSGKYVGDYYSYSAGVKDESSYVQVKSNYWQIIDVKTEGETTTKTIVSNGRLDYAKDGTITIYYMAEQADKSVKEEVMYTGSVKDGVFTAVDKDGKPILYWFTDKAKGENKDSEPKEEAAASAATLEEATDEAAATTDATAATTEKKEKKNAILSILDKVHDEYLVKATSIFDGKQEEYIVQKLDDSQEGKALSTKKSITETLGGSLGAVGSFVSGDTIVGLIALILGIVFIIIFASICKMGKRREKREAKMEAILAEVRPVVEKMRRTDPSLMSKALRKQYMWETIITNALRNANGGDDDDDDDDF